MKKQKKNRKQDLYFTLGLLTAILEIINALYDLIESMID